MEPRHGLNTTNDGERASKAELLKSARKRTQDEETGRAPRLVSDKRFVTAAASGGLLAAAAVPVVANGDVLVLACAPYATC